MRWADALVVMLLLPGSALVAQDDCFPADDSHEARALAIVSVPLAFTASGGSGPATGGWALGVEAAFLPEVPDDLATPTTCRPGKGPENANPLPGFARLRVAVVRAGWEAEAGWIPPVRVAGVRANLVGLAVGRVLSIGSGWQLASRLHLLLGSLRAPITCDDDALADPASECFGGSRSEDRLQPGIRGGEVALRRRGARWSLHVGAGYSRLRPRLQVDFTNALGETDRRRVTVDLDRAALFGGVTFSSGPWRLTAEGYGTLSDRLTARMILRRALARSP